MDGKIEDFRYIIWDKLRNGATLEETIHNDLIGDNEELYIFLGIPFGSCRILGFKTTKVFVLPHLG